MNHVFLSYRHESDDHAKAVRNLGDKLKAADLPVELDQFYFEDHPGGPDEGWRKWCEDRAEKSACVLIVCSKGWFDSYRKEGPPGRGLGAALEAAVFSGEIYDAKGRNARVRLVNLDNFSEAGIPRRLKDWHIFRPFSGVEEFDQMTKWIRQRLAMPKVVFLAECAFDMRRERKKLQSFLEDKDWQVRPTSKYDLASSETALQADLKESIAFIQLLESYPRETGFDRQQREAAKPKPRFLFRDEKIAVDEADAQHREFLSPPDVITGSFDDFQVNVAAELKRLWEQPAPHSAPPGEVAVNDVFISCKNLDDDDVRTRDAEIAAEVYDFLKVKGLRVFLSNFTLEELGVSDYTSAIDSALESASVLLAIGTSADHLESDWVKYEWIASQMPFEAAENRTGESSPTSKG